MPKKLTKEEFIKKANEIHKNKFNYDEIDFIDRDTKVKIKCPIHGFFMQAPREHLRKDSCACRLCSADKQKEKRKMTIVEFVDRAKSIHCDKYDYDKFVYVNAKTKGIIICKEHGEFLQTPDSHLRGKGCPRCKSNLIKKCLEMTFESFIEKAKKKYADRFDYSSVVFINHKEAIDIICKEHGHFTIPPHLFLRGQNCPECGRLAHGKSFQKTQEQFIDAAKKIHGNRYDYSLVEYDKSNKKVKIICHEKDKITGEEHGVFYQNPCYHLKGQGCPKCNGNNTLTDEEFIRKSKERHGDKYDYSKSHYINSHTPLEIICPKHGSFWQMPYKHLLELHGCPSCSSSKLEMALYDGLKELGIEFEEQKKFNGFGEYRYDFFITDKKLLIECHGIQHFKCAGLFSEESKFEQRVKNDILKYHYAIDNGYKIIYVLPLPPDNDVDYKLDIFEGIYYDDIMYKTTEDALNYVKSLF